jgi:tetratricopeptide (TPR) repeat protein
VKEVLKMEIFCSYHPTKPASWECPECNECYCGNCISKRSVFQYGKKTFHYFCPKCNVYADRISIGNSIIPFWKSLHKIFIYPFHIRIIIFLLILSVATAVFTGSGLISYLVRVAVWGILLKYSFSVLKETANGKLTPPRISLETISDDFQIVFKQIAVYVIIFIAFAIMASIGTLMGIIFIGFAILSLPAMITVLVVTDSLIAAVNPVVFVKMAWRIGWAYLVMYLFLTILLSAPAALGYYLIRFLPDNSHLFLISLAESYYSIIAYHLMGYVMLQYHEEIGWDPEYDEALTDEKDEEAERKPDDEIINRIDMFIKDGNIDHAVAFIKSEVGTDISNLGISERYFKILKIKRDSLKMAEHGKSYLDLLITEKKWDEACQVYSDCLGANNNFTPSSSSLLKIGSLLNEKGNFKGAIDAYNRFVKSDPDNPLTPKVYFLSANILNEKLAMPQKAAKILNAVIKKYPDNAIVPHAVNYLKKMQPIMVASS